MGKAWVWPGRQKELKSRKCNRTEELMFVFWVQYSLLHTQQRISGVFTEDGITTTNQTEPGSNNTAVKTVSNNYGNHMIHFQMHSSSHFPEGNNQDGK